MSSSEDEEAQESSSDSSGFLSENENSVNQEDMFGDEEYNQFGDEDAVDFGETEEKEDNVYE